MPYFSGMKETTTKVVSIHDVNVDKEYYSWINEIKTRYRGAQIKATIRVNSEQLRFNWLLGRDLVIRKAEEKWGSGIVEQVSLDLQAAFPQAKGFSTTNIWNMKKWFLFYSSGTEKLHQLGGEMHFSMENYKDLLSKIIPFCTKLVQNCPIYSPLFLGGITLKSFSSAKTSTKPSSTSSA